MAKACLDRWMKAEHFGSAIHSRGKFPQVNALRNSDGF